MKIQIRANEYQRGIIQQKASNPTTAIVWYQNEITDADAYIDLQFAIDDNIFSSITNKPVIVNAVIETCNDLPASYSRINGWNTFLEKDKLELATNNETRAGEVLQQLGYQYILVPDIIGMIAPRNIAMIINEAYFALEDNISTKEQIDTAMKLGTNYPYGPFEWCEAIGIKNISNLLDELSKTDERYLPSKLIIDKSILAKI